MGPDQLIASLVASIDPLTGCHIGWGSIIGAHALVTENKVIPPRSLVLGSPGRVVREITDEELQGLLKSAAEYVGRAEKHRFARPQP